jgi:hypothetical protein
MILADVVLLIMLVLTVILVAALVAGFIYVQYAIDDHLGRSILDGWARSAGVELVRVKRRRWRERTPFNRWASRNRTIYRALVRTDTSRPRAGWVRCGHWFWGLLIAHADVVWDEDDAKFALDTLKEPALVEAEPLWDRDIV